MVEYFFYFLFAPALVTFYIVDKIVGNLFETLGTGFGLLLGIVGIPLFIVGTLVFSLVFWSFMKGVLAAYILVNGLFSLFALTGFYDNWN